jgi:hypothetical protein
MAIIYQLGITSVDAVTLNCEKPEIGKKQMDYQHRASTGILYQTIINTFHKITLPLEYVPNSHAAIINSWWESQTLLRFFVTSDTATDVRSVMITGAELPLNAQEKPYDSYFSGKVVLEGY